MDHKFSLNRSQTLKKNSLTEASPDVFDLYIYIYSKILFWFCFVLLFDNFNETFVRWNKVNGKVLQDYPLYNGLTCVYICSPPDECTGCKCMWHDLSSWMYMPHSLTIQTQNEWGKAQAEPVVSGPFILKPSEKGKLIQLQSCNLNFEFINRHISI